MRGLWATTGSRLSHFSLFLRFAADSKLAGDIEIAINVGLLTVIASLPTCVRVRVEFHARLIYLGVKKPGSLSWYQNSASSAK